MNFKLLRKLIRRFTKLKAGEQLDAADVLTAQEWRECRHMLERFYSYGDREGFEVLAAFAIADIYGCEGRFDPFIAELIRRIRMNTADKESLQLVLGLLKTLPQDSKYIDNLAALIGFSPSKLTPDQVNQQGALQICVRLLGDRGPLLQALLEEVVKTRNTAGLIGHPPVLKPNFSSEKLLQWALELEGEGIVSALIAKRRQDSALPGILGNLLSDFLSSKKYKAARFLVNLALPCGLSLPAHKLSEYLESFLIHGRAEATEILLKAFAVIEVVAPRGRELPEELMTCQQLEKYGYGMWHVCEHLCLKAEIKTANGIPLFKDPGIAVDLCRDIYENNLLNLNDFPLFPFAKQFETVKAIAENAGDKYGAKYGVDSYRRLCRELTSYPELYQTFCPCRKFDGPLISLHHAVNGDDITCLTLANPDEIVLCLAKNIKHHTEGDLACWAADEEIRSLKKSLCFKAMQKGSLNFLHWLEETVRFEALSPLQTLKARILRKNDGKYWPVALRFLISSVGKAGMIFLLKRGFVEAADLPPELLEALHSNMTAKQYALAFHWGEAAWQGCGLSRIPAFISSRSRCGFDMAAYSQLCFITNTAAVMAGEEVKNATLEQAFKLSVLFGTPTRALEYIEKFSQRDERWPLHRLCQFELPAKGFWKPGPWGDFVLVHGPEAAPWVVFAPYFEKAGLGVPGDLTVAADHVVNILYGLQGIEPGKLKDFARLCASYQIDPKDFATCRRIIEQGLKNKDNLPDIFISGDKIGIPGYYLKKLPPDDLRGFMLGKITNCCQYVGSEGGECAIIGMTAENSGFYVVCKMAGDAPDDANDMIVAQLWAWVSGTKALVMDSWERLRVDNDWMCQRFLSVMCDIVQPGPWSDFGIRRFVIGGSGDTPSLIQYQNAPFLEKSPFPKCYSDARKTQYGICKTRDLELMERQGLLHAAAALKATDTEACFLVKMEYGFTDVWVRYMGHLLASQRAIKAVSIFTCQTLEGVPHFLIIVNYEGDIAGEFLCYPGYSGKAEPGALENIRPFKF